MIHPDSIGVDFLFSIYLLQNNLGLLINENRKKVYRYFN